MASGLVAGVTECEAARRLREALADSGDSPTEDKSTVAAEDAGMQIVGAGSSACAPTTTIAPS